MKTLTDSIPNEIDVSVRDMNFWEALGDSTVVHTYSHTCFPKVFVSKGEGLIRLKNPMHCIHDTPSRCQSHFLFLEGGGLDIFYGNFFSRGVVKLNCKTYE